MNRKMILAVKVISVVATCLSLLWAGLTLAEETEEEGTEEEPWQKAEIYLSLGSSAPNSGYNRISELISQESDGRIYCNVYFNGDMGNDTELMTAVQEGTISLVQCATSSQTRKVPELALLDIPYLFETNEECDEKLETVLKDFFQPYYNQAGLQLITWYCPELRRMTCNFPVEMPEDLTRLKIRVLDSKYHEIFWQAVGAETLNIPFTDLFYSLQQGLVNAQENSFYATNKPEFYEVQDTVVLTDHIPYIGCVVMNKPLYDSMDPADQEILNRVFREVYSGGNRMKSVEELQEYFVQVIVPDPGLKAALRAGVPAVEEALRTDLGDETVDAFYAIVK